MPVPFLGAVGVSGVEQHAQCSEQTEAGDDEADDGCAEMGRALDDIRRHEGVSVEAGKHEEHEDAEFPDAGIQKGVEDGATVVGRRGRGFVDVVG